jgi:small conductance mechanosensitive channel
LALQTSRTQSGAAPTGAKQSPTSQGEKAAANVSEAERIVHLQRAIEADKKELDLLKARLQDPTSEYDAAEMDFGVVDTQLTELKRRIRKLQDQGQKAEAQKLEQELKATQEDWQNAKVRFELALVERRTLQDKLAALNRKIEQEQATLKKLREDTVTAANWFFTGPKPASPSPTSTANTPTATAPVGPPAPTAAGSMPGTSPAANPATAGSLTENKALKKEVEQAREAVRLKGSQAEEAKEKAKSVQERILELRTNLELEQRLHSVAKQKADSAQADQAKLEKDYQQKLQAQASEMELKALEAKVATARQRYEQARTAHRSSLDRIKELQTELDQLQSELLLAQQEADRKSTEAKHAQQHLEEVENPYTWRNIQQWLLDHGPRLLLILLGMWVIHRLVKLTGSHVVRFVARNHKRGSVEEKEARAKTLESVLHSTSGLIILIGGGLMLLVETGLPVMPLLGGAGIFGLAIAFGAQNLIKDCFCGFMVLMEDQYAINDYVQIGNTAGVVEQITLRVTVLRDKDGILHFIPHGTINTVSNFTHTWSRSKIQVEVAYHESIDQAMQVLRAVVRDFRSDPIFADLILDDAESMGVSDLTDTGVKIQFYLKTRPMQQWTVRREILRRIKNRFEEEGISMPLQAREFYPPMHVRKPELRSQAA